jgi:hypothetical protein
VFQRAGTLYLISATFTNNTATGGLAGSGPGATAGQGVGGALFVMSGATAISLGSAPTFSGNSASDLDTDVYGTLTTDPGATLIATAGTPQAARLNQPFAALQATLTDGTNSPIPDVVLPFRAPPSGTSATLSPLGGPTDASGQVSVMATANGTGGRYTVTAGGGLQANFDLQNVPPPVVTNVTSTTPNGAYDAGTVISVQVTFSAAVNVSGTPKLTLKAGAVKTVAHYTGGSGTNTLTFTFTVTHGENTPDPRLPRHHGSGAQRRHHHRRRRQQRHPDVARTRCRPFAGCQQEPGDRHHRAGAGHHPQRHHDHGQSRCVYVPVR